MTSDQAKAPSDHEWMVVRGMTVIYSPPGCTKADALIKIENERRCDPAYAHGLKAITRTQYHRQYMRRSNG